MAGRTTKLRCLLVWQGTLLQDHLFGPGSRITVAARPRATFVLPGAASGRRGRLLLRSGRGRATVFLRPGMRGSLFLAGRENDVAEMLAREGASATNGATAVELAEGDGGVLVFGQTGLGFWVVSAHERAPRARAAQVLGADRFTGKVFGLALAVLVLVSFVSRLFAGTRPEMTIEQLPDRLAAFVVDDSKRLADFRKELNDLERQARKRNRERRQERNSQRNRRRVDNGSTGNERLSAEERRLREKVSRKGLVGALGRARHRGPLKDVLGEGGLGMDLADAVRRLESGQARARMLTSTAGDEVVYSGLVARATSGPGLGESLAREAAARTGSAARNAGRAGRLSGRRETRITVDLPSSGAQLSGGELSRREIFKVVNANKGAIRYCYESQLLRFPTLRGKITVDFIINPDGRVGRVRIADNKLNQSRAAGKVASCLVRFISRWRFPRPRGGKVRVIYPFTFGRK